MPKYMRGDPPRDPGSPGSFPEHPSRLTGIQGVSFLAHKEPGRPLAFMRAVSPEGCREAGRKGGLPLPIPFPKHSNESPWGIQIFWLEATGLSNPKP